ncbi:MAG: chromosome segregation protein SMC [Deltaproteobacteria bacterium]|nr:chromosome segregation protein SMC [Deltaproteobacteria bacterium]
MRIKQLELIGFKSFRNKTTLSFPAGITAIVGPNGCGKSNVVDGLRWVLGEQSAKHLRGQEMGDVIFAGNEHSSPMGMAEVTLILENGGNDDAALTINGANGSAGIAPLDWTEVMISRRYFRSGESEYLFNKVPCRLRDIVEFFLGTGAGTKAYSMIEQGRVDHLLNAKPEEIRLLVEEAAGVSLFRSRRIAAERKLERTQENLSRVADLLRELERQLGSLRRQAKKAEQYRAFHDELKTVDLTLLSQAFRTLSGELAALAEHRAALAEQETQLTQEEQRLVVERAQALEALAREEATLHEVEEQRRTLESRLQQGEQRKQFLVQQEQQHAMRAVVGQEEANGIGEKRTQAQEELRQLEQETTEALETVQEEERLLRAYEQEASDAQRALARREAAGENIKTEIVDLLTQEAQVQNSLAYARRRANEIEQRLAALAREAERIHSLLAETEQSLLTTQTRLSQIRDRLRVGEQRREEKTGDLRGIATSTEQLESELAVAWARQAELQTRLATLQELEEGFDHYPQGVRTIMANPAGTEGVCGVVAQVVEVPQVYERAVAAVLREKLEYVVVSQVEDGLNAVAYLRDAGAGRGSFIPLHPRVDKGAVYTNGSGNGHASSHGHLFGAEGVQPLLEVLNVDPRYRTVAESLLGEAVLAPSLEVAFQLWQQNGALHTFVTLEGDVISSQGIVSGGNEGFAEEALLERRREIRALRQEVGRHEHVVAELVQRRQEMKTKQQELEGEIALLEAAARILGQEREALQREEGRLDGEQRRLFDKQEGVAYESQTLESERQALMQEILARESREAELRICRQERETALSAWQGEIAQAKVALEQQRLRTDELRVRVAERRERQQSLRAQVARVRERQHELDERLAVCQSEVESATQEIVKIKSVLAELANNLSQTEEELEAAVQEQAERQATGEQLRAIVRTHEAGLDRVRESQVHLQEEKTKTEVGFAQKRGGQEHIEETVRDRYALTMAEVLPQYKTTSLDVAVGETRRQELREKLSRLGEVNPAAATELAEVEERYTFLQVQETDLRRSMEDLQTTIAKLNRESRERLRDTFTLVAEKFREVYCRLVDGGKAQLSLSNEADLSESGVEIEVQPPGKRLRSLQLLSGGEKALAALSFTFALFLIRPSPFCVLDEVDAPLDDANVDRFNQLIREMSETTQIILITHNKRTMEAASTLYGVTMQEPGVSTIVSVQVS